MRGSQSPGQDRRCGDAPSHVHDQSGAITKMTRHHQKTMGKGICNPSSPRHIRTTPRSHAAFYVLPISTTEPLNGLAAMRPRFGGKLAKSSIHSMCCDRESVGTATIAHDT